MIICFVAMALVIFVADILIKQSVEERLNRQEERLILDDKVVIRKVYNKGMMMNLFDAYPKAVELASVVCGGFMLLYDALLLCRKKHRLEKTGMMFLTGGALSNIFDRVFRGKVIDYIGFRTKWKKITELTFNLGDFFIFAGAALVCLSHAFRRKKSTSKRGS